MTSSHPQSLKPSWQSPTFCPRSAVINLEAFSLITISSGPIVKRGLLRWEWWLLMNNLVVIIYDEGNLKNNSCQDNKRPEIMIGGLTSMSSQASLQLLIVCLDQENESGGNLFLSYLSRWPSILLFPSANMNPMIIIIMIMIITSRILIAWRDNR